MSPQNPTTSVVEFSLWQNDVFSSQDLINYIEINSLHNPRFNAMEPWADTIRIENKKLIFETFLMNPEKEVGEFRMKFGGYNP